jgi:peptide-methionine (S)-S-oxide reductase
MKLLLLPLALAALAAVTAWAAPEGDTVAGTAAASPTATTPMATAILAGGNFWAMQADLEKLRGVGAITVGYTGGSDDSPTYDTFHDGRVPHVEAMKLQYDPEVLSYRALLDYYFHRIDPFDGGGQFCDRGVQYRPVIFYGNPEQHKDALAERADVIKALRKPIAVQILSAQPFWPAEDEHQDYAKRNPVKYLAYRAGCGRDAKAANVWAKARK